MSQLIRPDGTVIYYEVTGSGYPILALASGGAGSCIDQWRNGPIHPVAAFSGEFKVIVMDQRYGGNSRAPLAPFSYEQSLGDQLAVLDTENIADAHLIGTDIGCSHALRLSYDAPARITVLHNGVLIQNNTTIKGLTPYTGLHDYPSAHKDDVIWLQDHDNKTQFRNIWIRKL